MAGPKLKTVTRTQGNNRALKDGTVKYDKPRRSDNPLGSLDLTAMNLQPGEHVRYRMEVRDRKGKKAYTAKVETEDLRYVSGGTEILERHLDRAGATLLGDHHAP